MHIKNIDPNNGRGFPLKHRSVGCFRFWMPVLFFTQAENRFSNQRHKQTDSAQWSEGVTKPPWTSEQIEVNFSILEAFGYILFLKTFLKHEYIP